MVLMHVNNHCAVVPLLRTISPSPKAALKCAALILTGMKVCLAPGAVWNVNNPQTALCGWPAHVNRARLNHPTQKVPQASSHIYLFLGAAETTPGSLWPARISINTSTPKSSLLWEQSQWRVFSTFLKYKWAPKMFWRMSLIQSL